YSRSPSSTSRNKPREVKRLHYNRSIQLVSVQLRSPNCHDFRGRRNRLVDRSLLEGPRPAVFVDGNLRHHYRRRGTHVDFDRRLGRGSSSQKISRLVFPRVRLGNALRISSLRGDALYAISVGLGVDVWFGILFVSQHWSV